MNSELIENDKEPKFPKLMISKSRKSVVLFTGPREGMVVYGEGMGLSSVMYCSIWDMGYFKDFDGKVILSNK